MHDLLCLCFFFFSSRRRHTRCLSDWSSDVCSSDLYFLARQADLGRAGGTGVVHGLMVTSAGGTSLVIAPGHGVTVGGETVILPKPRSEERRVGKECRSRWWSCH